MTQNQPDNRSFIHVKMLSLLPKGERKFYFLHQDNGRTVIQPNAEYGKLSLDSLWQKLANDPEINQRYALSYDPEAKRSASGSGPKARRF